MTKIKTFKFKVYSDCTDDNKHMKKQNAHDEYLSLYNNERIDLEINYFCKDKDVIDIKINEIYQLFTQDSGTNVIHLLYTVIYNEN